MLVLGIETSCDDTSVALLEINPSRPPVILASALFSQTDIHARFGGVVPEIASRNHLLKIGPLYSQVLEKAGKSAENIDLIAVTNAPGLIGALFVGVSFAKGLAYALRKPIIPVHHLAGHILSAELSNPSLFPPYTALVISGGHSHIYSVTAPAEFALWGRTIDDAAGEAFDKVAKMLGGTYPGGPFVETLAAKGNPQAVTFPVALRDSNHFSFSGLKTSVLTKIAKKENTPEDIAASFQHTIASTLAEKTIRAARESGNTKIVVAGGVACNEAVRRVFIEKCRTAGVEVLFPDKKLCGDNAVMIAYAAWRLSGGKNLERYYNLDFPVGDTKHEISFPEETSRS